ncbi:MAG: hypothetical protein KJ072_16315 [Verrucomicrobia bacterium]|nr:hypothetical protein [Verrucomicrobiota bacterium]
MSEKANTTAGIGILNTGYGDFELRFDEHKPDEPNLVVETPRLCRLSKVRILGWAMNSRPLRFPTALEQLSSLQSTKPASSGKLLSRFRRASEPIA